MRCGVLSGVRDAAMKQMEAEAKSMGTNAVVGVRFSSSTISTGSAEIYVYGTAVKF